MAGGIAVFLAVGDPSDGHGRATALDWVIAFSVCGAIIVGDDRSRPGRRRRTTGRSASRSRPVPATRVTAALTKQVVTIIDRHGVEGLFMHWPVYALAVFSIVGLILNQSAFNAGALAASLPALAVTNPVLSSILGVALFEETLAAHGVLQYRCTALAVVVMIGRRDPARPLAVRDRRGGRPSAADARVALSGAAQVWSGWTRDAIGSSSASQSVGLVQRDEHELGDPDLDVLGDAPLERVERCRGRGRRDPPRRRGWRAVPSPARGADRASR